MAKEMRREERMDMKGRGKRYKEGKEEQTERAGNATVAGRTRVPGASEVRLRRADEAGSGGPESRAAAPVPPVCRRSAPGGGTGVRGPVRVRRGC